MNLVCIFEKKVLEIAERETKGVEKPKWIRVKLPTGKNTQNLGDW